MKMYDMRRTSPFMEIIDILSDNTDVVPLFEFCQQLMCSVRLDAKQLTAAGIVEIKLSNSYHPYA